MIELEGYASATSASPGEKITFHLRLLFPAARGRFVSQIDIYRKGKEEKPVHSGSGTALSAATPANAYEIGCGWPPAYTLLIPNDWSSGVYLARVSLGGVLTVTEEATTTDILFVVKAAAPGTNSKILFQLTVNTAQAYNNWGGKSLYDYSSTDGKPAHKVSFDRPCSNRQFYAWEYDFIRWLEDNCFEVEYCTNVDLHADSDFLNNYQLLLSVGHDEYWSKEMRDNVEAFVGNGGNVAFFGGNTCWWQVRFENNNRTLVCYRDSDLDPAPPTLATINWRDPPVNRPENSLTGVSYVNGAGWFLSPDPRPAVDFHVRFDRHWVFDKTGLDTCDGFGADDLIVGYETDAALFDDTRGLPRVTGTDGTPLNFLVLATANCRSWGPAGRAGMATMGVFRNRGTVFTAATTDWSQGLKGEWNAVSQITWNVLRRLSMPCPPSPHLANSGFEKWTAPKIPEAWSLEGKGTVSADKVAARNGQNGLLVDATLGQTWLSQGFDCEGRNYYRVGCWAKADNAGVGATIRLQSKATWTDFAVAQHSGSGKWEYLCAVGMVDNEGPMFPARVKIQVAQGIAWFDDVRLDAL